MNIDHSAPNAADYLRLLSRSINNGLAKPDQSPEIADDAAPIKEAASTHVNPWRFTGIDPVPPGGRTTFTTPNAVPSQVIPSEREMRLRGLEDRATDLIHRN